MSGLHIDFLTLLPSHVDGALQLTSRQGWPHTRDDWVFLLSLSQGIVALLDGQVVGTAVMTPYGPSGAMINMVIVDTALRGKGVGKRLFEAVLELCQQRECRLYATIEGLPLYRKFGFHATGGVGQYQGTGHSPIAAEEVLLASPEDFDACVQSDSIAFGQSRRALLEKLNKSASMSVVRGSNGVEGFACVRNFGRGLLIGPIVGSHPEIACALVSQQIAKNASSFIRIDVQDDRIPESWLRDRGLLKVGVGIEMRRNTKPAPKDTLYKSFALASQALG